MILTKDRQINKTFLKINSTSIFNTALYYEKLNYHEKEELTILYLKIKL